MRYAIGNISYALVVSLGLREVGKRVHNELV